MQKIKTTGDFVKKESITLDSIKNNIKMLCKYNVFYNLLFSVIITGLLSPILFFVREKGITFVFIIVLLLALFYFGYNLYAHIKIFIAINKGNYKIETDKLVQKNHISAERYTPFKPNLNLIADTPNVFYFSKYKKYRIPTGENYSFSQKYCMNSDGIYRLSDIGDEFYLVIINDKIICAYNKKLFEIE